MDIKLNNILNFSVAFNQASVCSRLSALLKRIARSVSSLFATNRMNSAHASAASLINFNPQQQFLDVIRMLRVLRKSYNLEVELEVNTKETRSEIISAWSTALSAYKLLPKNETRDNIMARLQEWLKYKELALPPANTLIIEV